MTPIVSELMTMSDEQITVVVNAVINSSGGVADYTHTTKISNIMHFTFQDPRAHDHSNWKILSLIINHASYLGYTSRLVSTGDAIAFISTDEFINKDFTQDDINDILNVSCEQVLAILKVNSFSEIGKNQ